MQNWSLVYVDGFEDPIVTIDSVHELLEYLAEVRCNTTGEAGLGHQMLALARNSDCDLHVAVDRILAIEALP